MEEITSAKIQQIIHDDCITQLKKIKSYSVNIILSDPPYNIG